MKKYVEYNNVFFPADTPREIMDIVIHHSYRRFRVWFGDRKTGASWDEENDVCGTIGFSTGKLRVPLLIPNRNSAGGGELLADCIVKIMDTRTKQVLYQHPTFSQKTFANDGKCIYANGELIGSNNNEQSAKRFCEFMNGCRMNK